jgi:hypothetical protein
MAVLLIAQEIRGQGQTTPGEHRDQTLGATRTDHVLKGYRGDMAEDGAQLQTEATMGGHQGIASDLGSHLALAPDEMRQDGEHGFVRRALDAPAGDSTHTDAHIMRVAGQAPAAATARLIFGLKAKGEEKGEDAFDKRLAVARSLKEVVSSWKSTVMVRLCHIRVAAVPMCSPQIIRSRQLMRYDGDNTLQYQDNREGLRTLPRNAMECGKSYICFQHI